MKLLGNRVWIKPEVVTQKGSIILSRGSLDMPNIGTVTHIGTDAEVEFKIGDRVIFNKNLQQMQEDWSRTEVKGGDVLAVLEK
jgi:co-chaperonin GroES (HSP10)